MKEIKIASSLYRPIQPSINSRDKRITYREYVPDRQLQNIIYCYWHLKTEQVLSNQFNYRVVSDGCIDVFFDASNPVSSHVMGFCKNYTIFSLENSFNYVGIRFFPSMFPQLFKVSARDLADRFEPLKEIVPILFQYLNKYLSTTDDLSRTIHLLNDFFLLHLSKVDFNFDSRFYEALHLILKNAGVVEIEKELNTGISSRQLRRMFHYYIGTSPKTFSKVVRFQNILLSKPSVQSLKYNKLFYDIGYYDQAHFIKDFKNFYGVTPNQAFR